MRFAPGRLRLATRPNATGSTLVAKTIGMVVVAFFAASAAAALATLGYEPVASTPEEFATQIKIELETWGKVVRPVKIKAP